MIRAAGIVSTSIAAWPIRKCPQRHLRALSRVKMVASVKAIFWVVLATLLGPCTASAGAKSWFADAYAEHVYDRLYATLSLRTFRLNDTQRPPDENREETFLGYINELHEVNPSANLVAIGYRIHRHVAFEFSYDEIAARTMNFNNQLSDGIIRLRGPILNVVFQVNIADRFLPYLGLGYASWHATFNHDDWWTWGWPSPEAYQNSGSPKASPTGRRRFIEVNGDSSFVVTLGCAVKLKRNLELKAFLRKMDLTVEADAFGALNGVREIGQIGSFPMSHSAYGAGVRYVF